MDVSAVTGFGSESGWLDRHLFGARLVSSTLSSQNSGGIGSMGGASGAQETYDFSQSVISAALQGKGLIADMNV